VVTFLYPLAPTRSLLSHDRPKGSKFGKVFFLFFFWWKKTAVRLVRRAKVDRLISFLPLSRWQARAGPFFFFFFFFLENWAAANALRFGLEDSLFFSPLPAHILHGEQFVLPPFFFFIKPSKKRTWLPSNGTPPFFPLLGNRFCWKKVVSSFFFFHPGLSIAAT